jgi:hypothetical protein
MRLCTDHQGENMASIFRVWAAAVPVGLLALLTACAVARHPAVVAPPGAGTHARIAREYGQLPLAFEINQGQSDARVRFLARGAGYSLFLTADEAVLALRPAGQRTGSAPGRRTRADTGPLTPAIVRLALAGADPTPAVEGLDPQPGRSHYLIGNDPGRWQRDIARFGKVKYHQVYPGVDVVYYGNQHQLEYDFIVAPGVDPGKIQLVPSGVKALHLDAQGNLVLETAQGDLVQHKPVVYQDIDGKRFPIDGRYALLDKQRVGFAIGRYDARLPLVIDPVLGYSTYVGGNDQDYGQGIAVDGSGNAYVIGTTFSTDFPMANARQPANGGGMSDVFVSKLNASGTALVYSTYLGGSDEDVGAGIAVDGIGNAYVAGHTVSNDFPTVAPLQSVHTGIYDGFVAKLDASGGNLVYSTYLGGSAGAQVRAIAVDGSGNAYVTGLTYSTNFPVVAAPQPTFGGGSFGDAFVSKLNGTGNALAYSTYLGGNGEEDGRGIAVDAVGSAIVVGLTGSSNFPTVNALYPTGAGIQDAFVTRLNAAGNALTYSTYLGGSGYDQANAVAVDASGNAYVIGHTDSTDFPIAGAMRFWAGDYDAFVSKLNATGSGLVYSTYLGGSGGDFGDAIAVDGTGNAYVAGHTASPDFPTVDAVQTLSDPLGDAFVGALNPAGSALVYSTYLGGDDTDAANGIALDRAGNAYVVGTAFSGNFPTLNPLQAITGGGPDAFVAKIGTALIAANLLPGNDFNGDGRSDILWRNGRTGGDAIWRSANSNLPLAVAGVSNLSWHIVGVGDFNGDRKSDILWRNTSTGANAIWRSGSAATTQAVTAVTNQSWQVVGTGDFNGDGKADILWHNGANGANAIWKSGLSSTPQPISSVTNLAWHIVGADDFTGDGNADILWRNTSTGANVMWKSGNPTTQQAVSSVTSQAWHVVATGDFNGDGKADILWRNTSTGANVIWKSGLASTPQAVTAVTNLDWHIVAAGDYNGDGISDILWRNLATGVNVIWRSAKSSSPQAVTTVGSLDWMVQPVHQ